MKLLTMQPHSHSLNVHIQSMLLFHLVTLIIPHQLLPCMARAEFGVGCLAPGHTDVCQGELNI